MSLPDNGPDNRQEHHCSNSLPGSDKPHYIGEDLNGTSRISSLPLLYLITSYAESLDRQHNYSVRRRVFPFRLTTRYLVFIVKTNTSPLLGEMVTQRHLMHLYAS
jgi:hypothetical protein